MLDVHKCLFLMVVCFSERALAKIDWDNYLKPEVIFEFDSWSPGTGLFHIRTIIH